MWSAARQSAEVLGKAGARGRHDPHFLQYGHNTVPVEAALYAKERGCTVVCVTSKKISRTLASRAPEGKRLYEVSDIVIDNHAPRGDGLLTIPGTQQITGGASTFGSLFIAQRIVLKIENLYLAQGRMPPVPVQRQSARRRRIQYQRGGGVSGPYQSAVLRMR